MPTIRVPFAEPLTNRDSSTTKDSKLTNCFVQNVGGQETVVKRPGTLFVQSNPAGQGSGLYCYNSLLYTVTGGNFTSTGSTTIPPSPSATLTTGYPQDFKVSGNIAYIANSVNNTFQTIDITNPAAPFIINSYATVANVSAISVSGSNVYTAGSSATQRLTVTGAVQATVSLGVLGQALLATSTYVYLFSLDGHLYILDALTLATVGSVLHGLSTNAVIAKYGNFIYAQDGSSHFNVYNVTTPNAPTVAATNAYTSGNGDFSLVGSLLYGVGEDNLLTIRDVSAAPSFTLLGSVALPTAGVGVAVTSGRAYVTVKGPSNILRTFDVTNSSAPVATGADVSISLPTFCRVQGNYLYVMATSFPNGILHIYKIIDTVTTTTPVDSTTTERYSFSSTSSLLVFKNNNAMYTRNLTTGAVTRVTSANYPATTVPGLVYLDGTFYVGTSNGTIFGSAINDPTTWSALNFISAETENDGLVAIEKSLNYLVAFGQWTTEFFYDAANATGSPLASVPNAFFTIGCASGTSVVRVENGVVWMSQTIQRGRQIMSLSGFTPSVISSPEVDRILNADDLATVYSFSVKIAGSSFYVLTLKTSAKTLVYDFSTKQWHFWSSMSPQPSKSVTSLTYANGVVTAVETAHGYADGDLVTIAGASPSGYNGDKNITYIDSNTYSYPSATVLTSSAAGTITATGYTESYFNAVAYALCTGGDLIQGELDGTIYKIDPAYYNDNGVHINMRIRTVRVDGGDAKRKFNSKAEIIADKVSATAYLRYTDDDYQTYCAYRPVNLAAKRSMITRLGHTRRRAYEVRVTDSQPVRFGALELDLEQGTS